MATLGNATTPSSGSWFDTTGNKQYWNSATYTMPAGGGIANSINMYMAGNSGNISAVFVVWDAGTGNIFYQTNSFTINNTLAWKGANVIAGTYIPAGTYKLGFWSSGNPQWQFEASGGVFMKTGLSGGPGTATGTADEYSGGGFGELGAYVDYTPGGVLRVNTGTPGSPVWTVNAVRINTGTPGSPVWTNARWRVNTGTPGSPVWTDAT